MRTALVIAFFVPAFAVGAQGDQQRAVADSARTALLAARRTALMADLRNYAVAQEAYFADNQRYAESMEEFGRGYRASTGVVVRVLDASKTGHRAVATREDEPGLSCAVAYGTDNPIAPQTPVGLVVCKNPDGSLISRVRGDGRAGDATGARPAPTLEAMRAALIADLKNFASAQEAYFSDHGTYATSMEQMGADYKSSTGVTVRVAEATGRGHTAIATHRGDANLSCAVHVGMLGTNPISGRSDEGIVVCKMPDGSLYRRAP